MMQCLPTNSDLSVVAPRQLREVNRLAWHIAVVARKLCLLHRSTRQRQHHTS